MSDLTAGFQTRRFPDGWNVSREGAVAYLSYVRKRIGPDQFVIFDGLDLWNAMAARMFEWLTVTKFYPEKHMDTHKRPHLSNFERSHGVTLALRKVGMRPTRHQQRALGSQSSLDLQEFLEIFSFTVTN